MTYALAYLITRAWHQLSGQYGQTGETRHPERKEDDRQGGGQ